MPFIIERGRFGKRIVRVSMDDIENAGKNVEKIGAGFYRTKVMKPVSKPEPAPEPLPEPTPEPEAVVDTAPKATSKKTPKRTKTSK